MKYSAPGFAVTAARTQKRTAGFTLMELMIVVAIIGILASMAVPVYQGYAIRAQVSEGVNLASAAKAPIVSAFLDTGDAPATRASAGMSANATDSKGSYVTSIDVNNGVIVITYGENATAAIQGLTVAMTPYETAELGIVWRCGFAPVPAGLSPLGTSGGGNAAVYLDSTVAARHLPSACRP